jgi:zinc protease
VRAALVALLAVGCGPAAPPRPPAPDRTLSYRDDVQMMEAHNGMRILIMPDPSTNLVDVHVRFQVGAIDDPAGKAGLAHLVEHLYSLVPLPGGGNAEDVFGRVTLADNAYTDWDSTHHYSQSLGDSLGDVLAMEMGRLGADCAALPQAVFDREREVVRNEIRQRGGLSAELARWVLEAAYPESHPYRRTIGGDDQQLASITRADVCAFMAAHYAPSNATLIVAGATTVDEVKTILNRHLGALPPRPAAPRPEVGRAKLAARPAEHALDVDEGSVVAIYAMPPGFGLDNVAGNYALAMLSAALDHAAEGEDWISTTSVSRSGGVRAPVMTVQVWVTDPKHLKRAVEFIDKQVRALKIEATDFQLAMVRERGQTGLLQRAERLSSRAMQFGDYVQFDSSNGFIVGDLERLGRLSISDVQRVAKGMFAQRAIVMVRPNPKAALREKRAALTFSPHDDAGAARLAAVDPTEADRPLALPGGRLSSTEMRRFVMDNGMDVLLLSASTMPLIDIRLILAAGSAQDPPGKAGVADLAARLMIPSIDNFDQARELIDFWRMGGDFDPQVSDDFTIFQVRGAAVFLDGLVHGLGALMRHGHYDDEVVGTVRKSVATALDKPDTARMLRVGAALGRAMYGAEHPYARAAARTGAGVRSIGRGDLERFRNDYYVPRNATLVVAGRFDVELMEQHIRHAFGGWSSGKPRFGGVDEPAQARGGTLAVDDDDQVQIGVALAYPTGRGLDARHAARLVLVEMIEMRMRAVREKLGASYGIHASNELRRGPGSILVSGTIDAARGGEALATIRAGIDGIRNQDDQFVREFVLARRAVARRLIADATDSSSLADELTRIAGYSVSPRFFGVLVDLVSRLKPADVAALATRELAAARETMVVIADRPVIEATFKAAGLPPPKFLR